jgi:hypothetical protein
MVAMRDQPDLRPVIPVDRKLQLPKTSRAGWPADSCCAVILAALVALVLSRRSSLLKRS